MKDKIVITKIINYISDIEYYINDSNYDDFINDRKTLSACAFSVSQIGELVGNITDNTINKYNYIPWKSIRGMRNKIVHDYDNIDLSILWNTMKNDLPELKSQLLELVDEL